jgi:hypothetical protein
VSADTLDLVLRVGGFTVSALLIVNALLVRAGIFTFIRPRPRSAEHRSGVARAALLIGVGNALWWTT